MQVVYSGGSNTPTPSPRLQRKTGYGRPVMPGYMTHVHPQVLVQRSREKLTEGDITLRDSIPAMSKGVAITCLVLNIFIPGSGTLTSGLSVLCCSQVRPKHDTKRHCIWVNAGVALLQFLLTFLFLLGWIWSITWGLAFLAVSKQFYYRGRERVSGNDGEDGKNHTKSRSPRQAVKQHHLHTPSGSRAGSCASLNRIGTDNHRVENEQRQHHHNLHHNHRNHHHPQHHQRHNNTGRSSPNANHNDGNKHQNISKHVDHDHHHETSMHQLHSHHQHHHHHESHQQQHKPHYERSGHYHQQKSTVPERVCLHQDANDVVAVIPPEETAADSTAVSADWQNQAGCSSAPALDSQVLNESIVPKNAEAVINNETGQIVTDSLHIASLPNSTIEVEENSATPTPVLTIPVAPYSGHDTAKNRRHKDHIALQPIITLQRVPEHSTDVPTNGPPHTRGLHYQAPDEKVMRARTRHEKMLQRQMSDNDLSPFELTNQQLAAIIIHDFPVQSPGPSQSNHDQSVIEGLPKC